MKYLLDIARVLTLHRIYAISTSFNIFHSSIYTWLC